MAEETDQQAPERFRRRLNQADLERMRIPRRFWSATYAEVSDEKEGDGARSMRDYAGQYLSNLDAMLDRGIGLFLWGNNGLGKSSVAAVVLMEARRRGFTGLFLEAATLKTVVIEKTMFDDDTTLWERAKQVDLLVIDDLGKGVQDEKGFGERLIDEVVRHRAAQMRATWITTNMSPKEFQEQYKVSTFAAMKEAIVPVRARGSDRRIETRDQLTRLFGSNG